MDTLNTTFGGMFVAITAIFLLGLTPQWATRFYPATPPFLVRLAAPVIFALLATACFMGLAVKVLLIVIACGLTQIIVSRWVGRKSSR